MKLDQSDNFLVRDNRMVIGAGISSKYFDLRGIWVVKNGSSSSRILWNDFENQSLYSAPSGTGSATGVADYDIYVEDDCTDAGSCPKNIKIAENNFFRNSYNGYTNIYIDDIGFSWTPDNNTSGVSNTFSSNPGDYRIFSTNNFTYQYSPGSQDPTISSRTAPVVTTNVSKSSHSPYSITDDDYCPGSNGMPTNPITSKNGGKDSSFLSFAPNPSQGVITFKTQVPSNYSNVKLVVYDLNGRIILEENLLTGNFQKTINLGPTSSGTYIYLVKASEGEIERGKLFVTKN